MPTVKLKVDRRSLNNAVAAYRKQVPFATALALNSVAAGVKQDLQASMRQAFNNPNAYTLGAVFMAKATKARPVAVVGLKDGNGASTPAWKYLGPQVHGGTRHRKRFEIALGQDAFAVPGRGAKLDASGDINRTQLGAILHAVRGGDPVSAKVAKHLGKAAYKGARHTRSTYFVGKSRKSGRKAVYQVTAAGQVQTVLSFRPTSPTYSARWDFRGVVLASVQRHQEGAFDRAMAQALATAK